MVKNIFKARYILRHHDSQWILFRLWYITKQRCGLLKRQMPLSKWDEQPLKQFLKDPLLTKPDVYLAYRVENSPIFLFSPEKRQQFSHLFTNWDTAKANPGIVSKQCKGGKLYYFKHTLAQVGFPPNWHINSFTGQHAPTTLHWSQIDDFGYGDIKIIWEASRFGFVYSLVRAYWRTGDEQYAEQFWQLVENWRAKNPPQQGPNWKCGQEISFRVMAWCFGLYGFLNCQATTGERAATLAQMIAVSGKRLEANLGYALSQHNNHGISEGMGLYTIGSLFPEFRSATKWKKVGRQILESQGQELIYDDGSFVQHSVNYHRLMLHDYLWAIRLGDLQGEPFSKELKERVSEAGTFLFQIQDTESGQVPYYGQNDGALILPLNNCDYQDLRPVIQASYYMATGKRCCQPGPWDEDLLWLFGPEALKAPVVTPSKFDIKAKTGGYYTLRSPSGFMFTRCATFRHRPGQADMLHVDLWWQGQNIASDAGTYSYNAPKPWDNPLAHTAYHNTVMVDNLDQMTRVSKFLWLPWIRSQMTCYQQSAGEQLAYWEGEHDGYQRLKPAVRHKRGMLRLGDEHWLVFDSLKSTGKHLYRLQWLLPDFSYIWEDEKKSLRLQTSAGLYYVRMSTLSDSGTYSMVRADEYGPRGWRAPYYNYKEPALSIDLAVETNNTFFWTLFGPDNCAVTVEQNTMQIEGNTWKAVLKLQAETDKPLLSFVSLKAMTEDKMEISL